MTRQRAGFFALSLFAFSGASATAQGLVTGSQPFRDTAAQLKGQSSSEFGSVQGYTVAPGVIVTPSLNTEFGHDSNPDRNLLEESTAYGRVGGSLSATALGQRGAANINLSGTGLKLEDNQFRDDRWQAAISGGGVYTLAPGLSIAAGGLLSQNEIEFIAERVAGAYGEMTYANDVITSFVRTRFTSLEYLSDPLVPAGLPGALFPFFRGSAYNADRTEVATGLLVGNRHWIAPYAELSYAKVDYTRQPDETAVDRDADDYHAKGGLRFTLSPSLQADIGWRWNWRETQDARVGDFHSNYFDASLRWSPSPYFSLTAAIDRYIGEPAAPFSVLSDVKAYTVSMTYLPMDRWSYKLMGRREVISEVGDFPLFRRYQIASELAYAITPSAQFYTGALYEHVSEDRTDLDYERLKVGIGTRFIFGQPTTAQAVSLKDEGPSLPYAAESGHLRLPSGARLNMSLGYSWMNLPGTHMTTVIGGPFFDEALHRIKDHDGHVDGARVDMRLNDFAMHGLPDGRWLSFSAGGFYSHMDSENRSSCYFTATTDCVFVNIVDFDPANENNTGPFGQLETTTRKTAHYWGVEVDATLGRWAAGSIKDDVGGHYLSPFRFGLGIRGLKQRTRLHAIDVSVPDPVDYNEALDTFYYGGFVGYARDFALGNGFSFKIDGQAGVYYAHTRYEGRYFAYVPVGGAIFALESGNEKQGTDKAAFIGGLRLDLNRDLGWGAFSVFGKGEYLSYVPQVNINNDDFAGGSPFGVQGTQVGTRLSDTDAFVWTAGVQLSIPLQ